ncbi:DUF7144 family membrane protein [Nocardioides albus]|uniref:Glucan phosphoethanolaminetransferase (Alkaline phosphatase superfamily) n=1 Tax=Nocardioides albus TaxID=1841 RepID=A0A7W5F784_9ACTN|nr:hypothetical protein [Nocardioides albus]MBB3087864.1 glucan phosphoethanolaminetransferase (alkaline phosphatase superfamily) [Nocardioides albus]GGU20855.1 hypothetical protein GCM10007979_19300 [Nocardioides albus]
MSEQTTPNYRDPVQLDAPPPSGWATGFIVFAAVMMILSGGFQSFVGMAALFKNDIYVATPNYLLELDTTTWGWIHLLLGLLVLFAGFAVLYGKVWGRTIGVVLAVLSAIANFAFIPYYPFWSMLIIALDVFVIWALTAHGRDITR